MDHRAQFLDAMRKRNPRLYAFLARTNPELLRVEGHSHMYVAGFGAASTAPASSQSNATWWQSLLTSIGQAIPMGINAYQEIALSRAQVKNAIAGKPPIPMQSYVQQSVPTATVSVGVNPDTQKTMMWMAGGLGLVLVIAMATRGNRSENRGRR